MSKSLQDQLLALGIAKEKPKTSPAQKQRTGGGKRAAKSRPATPGRPAASRPASGSAPKHAAKVNINPENITLEQAYSIREQEEKSARQRARERKMEEDRKRAALNKQIREIVDQGRLNLPDASEARYFMYKERIRKVYASAEQLAGLNDGSLGVVYLTGGYHILSAEQIEAVRQISPEHVADLLSGASDDDELWSAYEQDQDKDPDQAEKEADEQAAKALDEPDTDSSAS